MLTAFWLRSWNVLPVYALIIPMLNPDLPKTSGAPMKKIVNTVELAECLHVHPDTVRRWVRHKKIPSTMLGAHSRRFNLDRVLKALDLA